MIDTIVAALLPSPDHTLLVRVHVDVVVADSYCSAHLPHRSHPGYCCLLRCCLVCTSYHYHASYHCATIHGSFFLPCILVPFIHLIIIPLHCVCHMPHEFFFITYAANYLSATLNGLFFIPFMHLTIVPHEMDCSLPLMKLITIVPQINGLFFKPLLFALNYHCAT